MASIRKLAAIALLVFCTSFVNAQSNVAAKQPNVTTINPTFTTIDVPGAGVTGVYGINSAGDLVGYYGSSGNDPNKHAFLYSGGNFTFIDYPNAFATFAYAINDAGLILGSAEFHGGLTAIGFSYDGSTFTPIKDGRQSVTIAYGISSTGEIVGAAGGPYTTKAFEMRGGKFKTLNVPGAYVYGAASGINKSGTIVGWADQDGFICHTEACQLVDYPGANQTANRGINDKEIVVGWYFLGGMDHGFALRNGGYVSFTYPGAIGTYADAINASGQIVGQYTFDYQTYHGFVTDPLTPAALR